MDVFEYIEQHQSDFIETLISICEIAAPTFHEELRARFLASLFRDLEFDPKIDESGNVIVPIWANGAPRIVLSAHLDTVFPQRSIRVERDGSRLSAPGISDDSAGLAALVLLTRAWKACGFPDRGTLTVLATVGEEGLGNLRGAKHFFKQHGHEVNYFISLDGCDAERLVIEGLASKRVRIVLGGPGGHSWGDAGTPNPIHLCGELLVRIHRLILPESPKTTINVGIIKGGTSVNTIPTEVSLDIDLRSESTEALSQLYEFVERALREVTQMQSGIRSEIQIIGERPSGAIRRDHPLVVAAIQSNRRFALDAKLETSSTDSNVPFALGIPALTTGTGGKCGKIHTPEEWYDVESAETGLKRTAMLVMELLKL